MFVINMLIIVGVDTNAFSVDDEYYDMLVKQDLKDYSKKIEKLSHSKNIGAYYKVGIMGHRRVVEIGEFKGLKYVELSSSEDFEIGTLSGMEEKETTVYEVEKTTMTSKKIVLGFLKILSTTLNFGDIGSVGTENNSSFEFEFESQTKYSEKTIKEYTRTLNYNFNKVIPEQTTVSVGQVALVAEFAITSSYTQEQNMFGQWGKIKNTEVKDYIATYIVATVTTFIYQKGFGTTDTAYHPFGVINLD